jgi:hypothetical protein
MHTTDDLAVQSAHVESAAAILSLQSAETRAREEALTAEFDVEKSKSALVATEQHAALERKST